MSVRVCRLARVVREIRPHLADGILDDRPPVGKGHGWKALAEIPAAPGMGMGRRCHGADFGPAEQLVILPLSKKYPSYP
jgi:hypothetical protein